MLTLPLFECDGVKLLRFRRVQLLVQNQGFDSQTMSLTHRKLQVYPHGHSWRAGDISELSKGFDQLSGIPDALKDRYVSGNISHLHQNFPKGSKCYQ